ncbi:MAG: TetR family transcriptional regulator [Polyangiaceae bacterium]
MSRWEPNARERLEQAAMQLYAEHGFDQTTVAEIAARAGLTERTFFRYFADKREVLFGGQSAMQELFSATIAKAPTDSAPLDAVAAALAVVAPVLEQRREIARQRQSLIVAHRELRERELIKLASLATIVAEALRRRGVSEPSASLVAETGIAVFRVAFERWVEDPEQKPLSRHIRESLSALKAASRGKPAKRAKPKLAPKRRK